MKPEEVKAELQQLVKSSEMLRSKIQLLADLKENIKIANYDGIKVSGTKKRDLSDLMVQMEQLEAEILEETDKNMAERARWNNILCKYLSRQQINVFLYRYLVPGHTFSDIAEKFDCSEQNIQKIHKKGLETLAKNIQ